MLTIHKKGSESKLLEICNSVKENAAEYAALIFNFSDLLEHYKTDYQLKISTNIISDLLKNAKGWAVIANDFDIFIICRNADEKTIKKLVFQLRYLYMDDPLAYDESGEDSPKFAKQYQLGQDWLDFYSTVRAKIKMLEVAKPQKKIETKPQQLTPEKLVNIEVLIGKLNIAPALRQQPICLANSDGFRTMFNEIYVNIASLAELLSVNVDFASNRSLFKYFTELLDVRVLELLRKTPAKFLRKAVSLNFNVETLLSDVFADFSAKIDKDFRKNIVIEIHVADIFTNMQAFQAARDVVQAHGYRLCLDGMDALSFRQLDRNSLGFDLAKMHWNADLKADKSPDNVLLQKAIDNCGKNRMILSRCDNEDAIKYGKSLGISLFQGRYVDKVLDPETQVVN